MNRAIKFRAWDKANCVMHNWETICGHFDLERFMGLFTDEKDAYELMQFTGLKDKNNREIYEGDILKSIHGTTGNPMYEAVEWSENEGWWSIRLSNNARYTLHDALTSQMGYSYEVIGNIYENPELLAALTEEE